VPHVSRFSRRGFWRTSHLHRENLPVIDPHDTTLSKGIVAKTAPAPQLRRLDESALNRIAVHVAQLFNARALRPDIEVVKPGLPD
jgi:hypothetical protein